jgi:hypothetical protein
MHSTTKRRLASPVIALVALATFAGVASAAPSTTLTKFGDGDVTITSNGATLANGADEYSGVYLKSKSLSDKLIANVDFSFNYTGNPAGGSPRFSIPLNSGTGETPYAFLDAMNCGTPGLVSTDLANCPVFINTGGSYANWDAMAAANPTWRIASGKIPFVIADQPGTYELSNIVLR